MADSALYKSVPLPSSSSYIRLLEVDAASPFENSSGPITTSLHAISLDDNPRFSALSYVWGHDTEPQHITCGTFTVPVTQNCYSALQHIRQKWGRFTIWIDGVCINQRDQDEKAHQIPLMGRIYTEAETVYAWLGEGNARSARAFSYLSSAGLLDYFPRDSETAEDASGSCRPRVWAAVMSLLISIHTFTRYPFPINGKLSTSSRPAFLRSIVELIFST